MAGKTPRLPPGCGSRLHEKLLFNPYQDAFQQARRLRYCLNCETQGSMDSSCVFICQKCQTTHESNLTAPRVYDRFSLLAGRGGGKTLIGAHGCREEMLVPRGIGWVLGPTYKILHDSTFPTLVGLIPPAWVKRWDPEHMEITLFNDHLICFRSLEDPERARGPHGVGWGWFDEAAQAPERAYDVFEPTLIKAAGIVICTTTPLGFDWTYDKIERKAFAEDQTLEPYGRFWACKYWTEENPVFRENPVMMQKIERAKRSMTAGFYAQEYRAERHNAEGLVYNYATLEKQWLADAKAVQVLIPEWPAINPERKILVGLDSGADHPFGAVKIVVTARGLVVVADYLQRMQAISQQLPAIQTQFNLTPAAQQITWAANKNEANLRLEFGLKGIGVVPAEATHEIGIQRVQSWLVTGQLFFAYTALKTFEQMRAYRYAPNVASDGQKKAKEAVFKFADELPDGVRYAIMAWPHLPNLDTPEMTDAETRRWNALDESSQRDIERMRAYEKAAQKKDLEESEPLYPLGEFFNAPQDDGLW